MGPHCRPGTLIVDVRSRHADVMIRDYDLLCRPVMTLTSFLPLNVRHVSILSRFRTVSQGPHK